MAVGNLPSAVDNQQQYRPREIPANRRIDEGAGDAVGILRYLLGTWFFPSSRDPAAQGSFKFLSNVLVAEEQALAAGRGLTVGASLQEPFVCASSPGRPGLSKTTGGRTSCYPSPAGFFPPCLRRRLRRKESGSTQLKRRCSYGAGHRLLILGRLTGDLSKTIHLI
jgi:hypothetical protein